MSKRMRIKNADGVFVEEVVSDSMVSTYIGIGWEIVEPKEEAKKEEVKEKEVKLETKSLSK